MTDQIYLEEVMADCRIYGFQGVAGLKMVVVEERPTKIANRLLRERKIPVNRLLIVQRKDGVFYSVTFGVYDTKRNTVNQAMKTRLEIINGKIELWLRQNYPQRI